MLLAKIAILFLWVGAVFDPIGQTFGIRYFSIALSVASIIWLIGAGKVKQVEWSYRSALIFFIAGVFPIYGLFIYSLRAGAGEFIDTSYIAAGLLMLFSLLYRDRDSCFFGVKAFLFSVRLLSILIVFIYLSLFFGQAEWVSFFTERSVALVSAREYSGFELPYIYFLASPLLILLIAYDFSRLRRFFNIKTCVVFALSSFSFLLTGTRAHIIIAIFFVPIYLLLTSNLKTVYRGFLFLSIFSIIGMAFEDGRAVIASFFSSSETSNSMKISLLDGYMEIFSHPVNLFFGQGFNAHEWSSHLRGMIAMEDQASRTELTYLEIVRVFGIFIALAFMFTLLLFTRATRLLPCEFSWVYPGLVIYLVNSAINPYLFSVNGMLPLGLFSAIVFYFNSSRLRKIRNN